MTVEARERPAPPPRSARRCKHGPMRMEWVEDERFHAGGYWRLRCVDCFIDALESDRDPVEVFASLSPDFLPDFGVPS